MKVFLLYLLPFIPILHFCSPIENTLEKLEILTTFEKTVETFLIAVASVIFLARKFRKNIGEEILILSLTVYSDFAILFFH